MQKISNKILSMAMAITLIAPTIFPTMSYAANDIAREKDDQNVNFDALLNNEHSYVANLDEEISLDILLSAKNNEYIESALITIENNNYKLGNVENEKIDSISENEIKLKPVNQGEEVKIELPIEFEKSDLINKDYFNKDSKVILEATLIDEEGNTKDVTETVENHLEWTSDVELTISQELKRYLKYENKTLVSFLVSTGIKDNKIPLTEKKIQMYVPKIADKEPSKIILPDQEYIYQDQILEINKKYVNEENNEVTWNSNDEFLVTFIYDAQMEDSALDLESIVYAKTVDGREIDKRLDNTSFDVDKQVGSLIEASISGDTSLNKGYLYTNLNREENKFETTFNVNYQINVGVSDLIDEIQIKENNKEENLTKKVTIDRDNLIDILGEDGQIKVLDQSYKELGILNKDTLELNVENSNLMYVTTKPIKEGNINIKLNKSINSNLIYTKESVLNMKEIENSIDVYGLLEGNEISNNHVINKIALIEPTSNASIEISKTNLSTVVKNENIVLTATLEKNDVTDMLYKNPEILITLPDKISNIELKDARLIYEDELIPVTFRSEGNTIYLKLEGVQTEYSSLPNANGTVVRIVMDITLDNLAVNSDENIIFQYTNRVIEDEIRSIEIPVKIVAPTGFVTANYGEIAEKVTSISEDRVIGIKANDKEKQINLSGTVVNNLGENATGFMILGRIPSTDTWAVDGNNEDLNSTYATSLLSAISVEGIDCDVYYSENGQADYNLENSNNGWTNEKKENSKSYLIVAKGEVTPGQRVTFNYNANIPRNLDYENSATSIFAVYYDNNSEEGISKNVISSKKILVETENIPVIKTEITATEYNTGDKIEEGLEVNLGKLIKYTVKATNTGRKTAENVNIKALRPENGAFYIIRYLEEGNVYDNYYDYSEELSQNVGRIEPGETKTAEFIVDTVMNMRDEVATLRAVVTADNTKEESSASFENKLIERTLQLNISSAKIDEDIRIGEKITYYLKAEGYKGDLENSIPIQIEVPKYMNLEEYENGVYDEEKRLLTFNIDNSSASNFTFSGTVTYSEEPNQEIALLAKAVYEGKEIKSNRYVKYIKDGKGITGTLSSNIVGKMLDTDTVEYYISVKNNSKKDAKISVIDYLPRELKIKSYTVKNGDKGYTKEDVGIIENIEELVQVGETLKVTIVAKPYILDNVGQVKEIENKVEIIVNGETINLNSIKQQIEGTSNFNTVVNEETKEEKDNIYSISGKVWYDENGNSKQDENEIGMTAVPLKLYDVNTKDYIKDEKGNILEIYTNDNGEYKFENLSNGEYIVSASYDNEAYIIANYQDGELAQNENNDFIESKLKSADSNIITINGENVYNTDLGLIDVDSFNIILDNKISKISVIDGNETKVYDLNSKNANVKLENKKDATVIVEYKIDVINQGNVDGYVTKIENPIPEKMRFVSELNNDWYIDKNGNAINTAIANTLIKAGEKITLTIILLQDLNEDSKELLESVAEIKGTYNKYGIEEVKTESLSAAKAQTAQIIVSKDNTKETMQVLGISVSLIAIITLFGVVIYRAINKEKIII